MLRRSRFHCHRAIYCLPDSTEESTGDVTIVPYRAEWPARFERISARLRHELADVARSVDHIGSTSIPGLASKDRIDVMITVDAISDAVKSQLDAALRRGGFQESRHAEDHRPPGDESHADEWTKFYIRGAHADFPFDANLHVRALGRRNHAYALLFRDYLRATPAAAKAYEAVKLQLAAQVSSIDDYVAIKDPVCELAMAGAHAWALRSGWSVENAMAR